MKLTKFQHACFVVEKDGHSLVVDLGNFTRDFITPHSVDAIVITHDHPDHFDESRIKSILELNPKATIIAHESIAGRFTDYTAVAAKPGEPYTVGAFTLQFFGGQHAPIADSIQTPPNLGVLIDTTIYYPGDSFEAPAMLDVPVLALPVSAPWLKASEAMEFLARVRPGLAFPTHDSILSADGKQLADRMLGAVASGQGTQYKRLDGLSIELS